jgi:hypothetical protein
MPATIFPEWFSSGLMRKKYIQAGECVNAPARRLADVCVAAHIFQAIHLRLSPVCKFELFGCTVVTEY